jgi:hypothetical protein
MHISLTEKRTLTAELADRTITDLEIESEWEGLTKLVHPASGFYLIVMREEGLIVDGSKSLIDDLLAPTVSPGYIKFPRSTLPCGLVVESFEVARYMGCIDADGKAYVSETEKPRVRIPFADAIKACESAGGGLIKGSQHLALAWDIINQGENWTSGKVGDGHVYRGLHKGTVSGAQNNDYVSSDPNERRWHVLSTGDRIYDFAGHLYSWMVNDLPGNANGLAGKIPADSPYLTTASQFSQTQGMGYRPDGARDWSGYALIRGSCWVSRGVSGVFGLGGGWPGDGGGGISFRCTK